MKQLKSIRFWINCLIFAAFTSLIFPFPVGPIIGVIIAQIVWETDLQ